MALHTLKNIKAIGQFAVIDMGKLREQFPDKFTIEVPCRENALAITKLDEALPRVT
jgi:hypothetical protein